MIKIYVLINPVNNQPFYVGSTKRELIERLNQHMGNSSLYPNANNQKTPSGWRNIYIQAILSDNGKPEIKLIDECGITKMAIVKNI